MPSRVKTITLEEWESKTQLTETQKQSVLELQDACTELPLPDGFFSDFGAGTPQRTSSPTAISVKENFRLSPNLRSTPSPSPLPKSRSTMNLEFQAEVTATVNTSDVNHGIPQPIETTQQFFDWFARMETDMEKDQEDVYRNFLGVVTLYRQVCDTFLEQIDNTVKLFNDLDGNFKFVEERTKAMQTACEKLLEEQNNLTSLADVMASKLAYYNELEPTSKLFNSQIDNICEQPDFVPILSKLDECIEHMQSNLRYRDSELYLMKFKNCMTQGMNLIKVHFIGTIKGLGIEISKKTNQTPNTTTETALFYTKFRTVAPKLIGLMREIEKRCPLYPEYNSLLHDCYNAYFSVRQQLLIPAIYSKITELGSGGRDILSFAKNGYDYMLNLCLDEYSLFYDFFSTGEDDLYGNLDLLCSYMYDYLRPRIIHEAKIETLSELCLILISHINRDVNNIDEGQGQGLQFSHLIRNVLQDAQQRLVFRVQTYIRSKIQNFIPQQIDLDYPDKLKKENIQLPSADVEPTVDIETKVPSSSPSPAILEVYQDNDDIESEVSNSPTLLTNVEEIDENNSGWFPTLHRTLWILSKLYRCVNPSIFDDIAQEVVLLCLHSLLSASDIITKKSRIDGQLFLIKHLLILKEQIASFDTQFVHEEKDLDFSLITDALGELLQNKYSILSPTKLIGLASKGIPKVVENRIDSKQEVDKELKRICEDFIFDSSKAAIEPLSSFLVKVSAFRLRNDLKAVHYQTLLKNQKFAQPAKIIEVYDDFQETVKKRLRYIIPKMSEYLDDRKTESVLLKPMQKHIIDTYQAFYDILQNEKFELDKFPKALGDIDKVKERVRAEWFWGEEQNKEIHIDNN
ncbi:hypothetical protein Glove_406g88 [Diversispora epigaea]|uniref:Conserved oligomeric Golgi complex subunit 3 n=1 Tax=Diversispora epigaea TaxID=1348612 RepID=A0A397H6P7_9GLOM|nr:hypothetical protein Glove_406g88 [Diversispora epigaea]